MRPFRVAITVPRPRSYPLYHAGSLPPRRGAKARATGSANAKAVEAHYSSGGQVMDRLLEGLDEAGIRPETATQKDLAPADQFHMGGAKSAAGIFAKLAIPAGGTVLDMGCGLGGPARQCALAYHCNVLGLDLSAEFVAVGNSLSSWPSVGLRPGQVKLAVGDVTHMKVGTGYVEAGSVDAGYMLHVGMNVASKAALAKEVARVLKPNALFGLFDPVAPSPPLPLVFPLPFASGPEECALSTPKEYTEAFLAAGLELVSDEDATAFCIAALEGQAKQRLALESERPDGGSSAPENKPLTLAVVMGPDIVVKVTNLLALLKGGALGAREMVWRKPADAHHLELERQAEAKRNGVFLMD